MADDNPTVETPKSDNARGDSQRGASSPPGFAIVAAIGSLIGGLYNAVMRGGEIQAAFRMGIDEIGQALKAFPDSVQARAEPGGLFEPLHSDISAARDQYGPRDSLPSPGDIANGRNFTAAEREDGNVQGRGTSENTIRDSLPSPGDIANGRNFTAAERDGGLHDEKTTQYAMGALFGFVGRAAVAAEEAEAAAAAARAAATAARGEGAAEATAEATADGAAQAEPKPDGYWAREQARRANNEGGNDQNYRGEGRSLADEQRARAQDRDRDDRGR